MTKRAYFEHRYLPYLLLMPQLVITLVFFTWPSFKAIEQAVFIEDAFGLSRQFSGLMHFETLWNDPDYRGAFARTAFFSVSVAVLSMSAAVILAGAAHYVFKARNFYRTFLIIPYAIAPILAGALWMFLFDPTIGVLAQALGAIGIEWNHKLHGNQAMLLVVIAAAWNMISYNFLFFLAGMQSIPQSLIEAAAIDGAGPLRRFVDVILPLISPTTFFLLIMNMVYAFFYTFGIIHGVTSGGPGQSTEILVFKIFNDGFIGLNYGLSAAQSIVLIVIVSVLTFIQFRYVERRVAYA